MGRALARRIFTRASLVVFRNEDSGSFARSLTHQEPLVTADIGFLFSHPEPQGGDALLVSLRPVTGENAAVEEACRAIADYVKERRPSQVEFIAMRPEDLGCRDQLRQYVPLVKTHQPKTPEEAARIIGGAGSVIAMRLHVQVLALSQGVPLFAIAYHRKSADLSRLGLPDSHLAELGAAGLAQQLQAFPTEEAVDMTLARSLASETFEWVARTLKKQGRIAA
jgi:polysaccharide pyruvyl transferase WcaK-like protein